jgi:hypothetical protein
VEAIHIVYTPRDEEIYSNARPDAFTYQGNILKHLDEVVGVQRYKDVPSSIKRLPARRLLQELERLTVCRWCRFGWSESNQMDESIHYDVSNAYIKFVERLAKDMYQITPPIVCRYNGDDGLLLHYPVKHGDISINVRHDAMLDSFESGLVIGAHNIVHIESPFPQPHPSPYEEFINSASEFAKSLVNKMPEWVRGPSVCMSSYHATRVKFVIHRPDGWDRDTAPVGDLTNSVGMRDAANQTLRWWIDNTPGSDLRTGWEKWSGPRTIRHVQPVNPKSSDWSRMR